MESVARWAEEFPRSGLVVCARRFSALELPGFIHMPAAPLNDEQMQDLTTVLGTPGDTMFAWCITGMVNDGDLLRDDTGRLALTEQGRRLARDGYFAPSRRSAVAAQAR